jgi:hypothetical protein
MWNDKQISNLVKYGSVTVVFHWLIVSVVLMIRGDLVSPIHFYYEPFWFQILLLLDFPALFIVEKLGIGITTSLGDNSVVAQVVAIIIVSVQWFVISSMFVVTKTLIRRGHSLD